MPLRNCLTEDALAEFIDGSMSADTKSEIHRHIRECAACRELIARLASSLLPLGQPIEAAHDPSVRALALSWSSGLPRLEVRASWEPPPQIDEYRIETLLGCGSMGRVYRGYDTRLERPVAIKFLAAVEPDAAAYDRFLIEARAIARLHHPNVVTCYRAGESSGRPYLVSELIQGVGLERLPTPIPWETALRIGLHLASGLEAAHEGGVLHRDIKPANVVLSDTDGAKLLDFGLAKLTTNSTGSHVVTSSAIPPGEVPELSRRDAQPITQQSGRASAIVGTPVYMAPEIWNGAEATTRSDVYSLGAVLYELCSGHSPHQAPTMAGLRHAVLTNEPSKLSRQRVPPQFADVIAQCMRREPSARFENGAVLRAELERIAVVKTGSRAALRAVAAITSGLVLVAIVAAAITVQRIRVIAPVRAIEPGHFQVTLQGPDQNVPLTDTAERDIRISVRGLPPIAADLRITIEVDGQRTRVWRSATANLKPLRLRLPNSSAGQKLKVEILAYSQHCSVAVGRGAVEWHGGDPRQLIGTFETCTGCWCAEHPPVGHRHFGVWAASEDAVWLVGENAPIQRYDGLSWIDETPGQSHHLVTVWGFNPDTLWAVGGCGNPKKSCPYPLGQQSNVVMRRKNGTWTKEASFGPGLGQFMVVWATGENDVWAAGSQGETKKTRGFLAHRDQTSWTEVPEGPAMGSSLHGIWGTNRNDLWLVGEHNLPATPDDPRLEDGKVREGVIWHHAGGSVSSWTRTTLSPALGLMHPFWGVWGTTANNVWAIANRGIILQWDGSDWRKSCSPSSPPYQPDLANIWVESPDATWVVGDHGSLVRWENKTKCWSSVPLAVPFCEKATGGSLYGIWSGGKDVWVNGECGTVYHYRSR